MGFQSAFRSGSEADLAEDDEIPERLFRMIVRGWYAGAAEKGKKKFLLGSDEIAPESLGRFETKRLFADVVQFCDGAFFDLGRHLPGEITGFEFLSDVTESAAEVDEAITEGADRSVLLGRGQECMFSGDLLGVCDDMGEAGLPVHADPVISSIAVAHQGPGKVFSEDAFGYLGRPMSVDMKEGEVFIACEPYIMPHAVIAPGGFIAMDHVRGPDLVAQIPIDGRSPCRCFAVESQGGGGNKLKAEQLSEQLRCLSIGNPDPIA